MNKESVNRIIDGWGRDILVLAINSSRHKSNKELIKFVREELSFDQVVSSLATGQVIMEYKSTLQSIQTAQNLQRLIAPFLNIPLSMLFFNSAWSSILKNVPLISTILGGSAGIGSTMVGGMVFSKLLGILYSLVSKIVIERLRRSTDTCAQICKRSANSKDPLKKWTIPVCASQCRLLELNKYVEYLKKESIKCRSTDKPDQCRHAILTQVIKVQNIIAEEQIHFNKVKAEFDKRSQGILSSASKLNPEKPAGI